MMVNQTRYLREHEVALLIEQWVGGSECSSSGNAMAMVMALGQLVQTGYRQSRMMSDATEVERTGLALHSMTDVHREALLLYHTTSNSALREIAYLLGCCHSTADARLTTAHERFWDGYDQARMIAADIAKRYQQTAPKPAPVLESMKSRDTQPDTAL